MYVITVEFAIDPKHQENFYNAVIQQAKNSLELEPDCHQFDVAVAEDDQCKIFLYEIYSDRAAFDLHLNSDHFAAFNARVTPWVKDKVVNGWHRSV